MNMAMNRLSYNAIAKDWDSARSEVSQYESTVLQHLLLDVPPSAKILDLGCGTGRPIAEYLLGQGLQITGVDQAEEMLALAKRRFPAGRWLHSPMEHFEPDEEYDGAVIWDSLFHMPRAQIKPVLHKVIQCLKPGARLILTVGGSDNPPFTDTMFGQRFFYDSLTPEATLQALTTLGAIIESSEFINPPTNGRDKGRYGIIARRP